jgi:protein-S-isoprenylcysteine O-methyltransferase Ste14
MLPHVKTIALYLWAALGIVWLAGALAAKPVARRQSLSSRLLQTALGALAVLIGFTHVLKLHWLSDFFVPASPVVAVAGLVLVLAGIGFAIWARFCLGGNWSGTITVKKNHTLVRRGPYQIVRHPIYSGLFVALVGMAIIGREVRGLIGAGLLLVMFALRSRMEERFMTEQFGLEYAEYKRQVKRLIPFVW